jgi:hypothetical protein
MFTEDPRKQNPFYSNHIFKELDTKRIRFSKWNWLWLWIFPTFVQCSDGYAFFYKNINGAYWLIKEEKL